MTWKKSCPEAMSIPVMPSRALLRADTRAISSTSSGVREGANSLMYRMRLMPLVPSGAGGRIEATRSGLPDQRRGGHGTNADVLRM